MLKNTKFLLPYTSSILLQKLKPPMDVEDEVLAELEDKERHIGDLIDSINKKDKALSEKDIEIEKQAQEIEELRKLLDKDK